MQNNGHRSIVADMLSDWKGYGFQIGKDMGPISLNSLGRTLGTHDVAVPGFLWCLKNDARYYRI